MFLNPDLFAWPRFERRVTTRKPIEERPEQLVTPPFICSGHQSAFAHGALYRCPQKALPPSTSHEFFRV